MPSDPRIFRLIFGDDSMIFTTWTDDMEGLPQCWLQLHFWCKVYDKSMNLTTCPMFLCQALEATTSGRIHAWQNLIMSDIYELSVWQNLLKHSILQSISGILDLFQRASLLNGAHSLVVAQGMLRPVFPILCLSASSASPTEKLQESLWIRAHIMCWMGMLFCNMPTWLILTSMSNGQLWAASPRTASACS